MMQTTIDIRRVRVIAAPTSEGTMYAIYGANKATRAAMRDLLGAPRPGGQWIMTALELNRFLMAIAPQRAVCVNTLRAVGRHGR